MYMCACVCLCVSYRYDAYIYIYGERNEWETHLYVLYMILGNTKWYALLRFYQTNLVLYVPFPLLILCWSLSSPTRSRSSFFPLPLHITCFLLFPSLELLPHTMNPFCVPLSAIILGYIVTSEDLKLGTTNEREIRSISLLCSGFNIIFSRSNHFTCQFHDFIFLNRIVSHYAYILHFHYSFTSWRISRLFPFPGFWD